MIYLSRYTVSGHVFVVIGVSYAGAFNLPTRPRRTGLRRVMTTGPAGRRTVWLLFPVNRCGRRFENADFDAFGSSDFATSTATTLNTKRVPVSSVIPPPVRAGTIEQIEVRDLSFECCYPSSRSRLSSDVDEFEYNNTRCTGLRGMFEKNNPPIIFLFDRITESLGKSVLI